MKNKKIIYLIIILIFIFLIIILINMFKIKPIGNNMNSQEIVDYILNLNSYNATAYIQVNSNKNTNKYILKQSYDINSGFIQEVIEPSNIAGIKITNKENKLVIENTQLSLTKIFENYLGIEENYLDLIAFLNDYKNNSNSSFKEEENTIIMETENNSNKYTKNKKLYINKQKNIPEKLVITDNNQNTTAIIEYNEIEIN